MCNKNLYGIDLGLDQLRDSKWKHQSRLEVVYMNYQLSFRPGRVGVQILGNLVPGYE